MQKEVTTAVNSNKLQTVDGYQEMYLVLINHEEQHSVWPSYKPIPEGWKQVFGEDIKERCLEYVEEHWTDMRPLSLRKQIEQLQKK